MSSLIMPQNNQNRIRAEISGETLVHANAKCIRCGKVHPEAYWLREDWPTRFKLMRFAAMMMASKGAKPPGYAVWNSKKNSKPEKLESLRQSRNGMVLGELQFDVAVLLAARPSGMTAVEIYTALMPPVAPNDLRVNVNSFRNDVLSNMVKSKNLAETDGLRGKQYTLLPAGRDLPKKTNKGLDSGGMIGEVSDSLNGEFMLGILVTPTKTFIAASGSGLKNAAFLETANLAGYVLCKAREAAPPHKSAFGTPISEELYRGSQGQGAGTPGVCAAPRLLEMAFEDKEVNPLQHPLWRMSEIFYLPKTDSRTKYQEQGNYWTHDLSAKSCGTCERLLPVLMCPYSV